MGRLWSFGFARLLSDKVVSYLLYYQTLFSGWLTFNLILKRPASTGARDENWERRSANRVISIDCAALGEMSGSLGPR
jgi:hypothetical protein